MGDWWWYVNYIRHAGLDPVSSQSGIPFLSWIPYRVRNDERDGANGYLNRRGTEGVSLRVGSESRTEGVSLLLGSGSRPE
jgi:hypothetical protein